VISLSFILELDCCCLDVAIAAFACPCISGTPLVWKLIFQGARLMLY
jgi:hypothetical protein